MAQDDEKKNVTLDDLLRIVDAAARTIERLQAVNASLVRQMRECELAAEVAVEDACRKTRLIEELEKSGTTLREDAKWCRWFKHKYGGSTFFSYIEREYRKDTALNLPAAGAASSAALSPQSGVARDLT